MNNKIFQDIVTIDGPAGVGKSTLARLTADKLNWPFLDTGAMFRYFALNLGAEGINLPAEKLHEKVAGLDFRLQGAGDETRLLCNNKAIGNEIRTEEISALASKLATRPEIREILKNAQQKMASKGRLVAEGRDMGTVVFPLASYKFFLDARPEVRALRRWHELKKRGEEMDLAQLTAQIRQRDEQDRNRALAPLKAAEDATIIDTSDLSIEEVLEKILAKIENAR